MANGRSLLDMSAVEIESFLNEETVRESTSTPSNRSGTRRPQDPFDGEAECVPLVKLGAANPPNQDGAVSKDGGVEHAARSQSKEVQRLLRDVQRQQKELETSLAEERGRRMACQDLWEKTVGFQREPGRPGPGPLEPGWRPGTQGPASLPGSLPPSGPVSGGLRACQPVSPCARRHGPSRRVVRKHFMWTRKQ
jgi:hypothetical protein